MIGKDEQRKIEQLQQYLPQIVGAVNQDYQTLIEPPKFKDKNEYVGNIPPWSIDSIISRYNVKSTSNLWKLLSKDNRPKDYETWKKIEIQDEDIDLTAKLTSRLNDIIAEVKKQEQEQQETYERENLEKHQQHLETGLWGHDLWNLRLTHQIQHISKKPLNQINDYRTIGVEYEFGEFAAGSPLQGLTHVQLTTHNGGYGPDGDMGYALETDASNELELVGPPLIYPNKHYKPHLNEHVAAMKANLNKTSGYKLPDLVNAFNKYLFGHKHLTLKENANYGPMNLNKQSLSNKYLTGKGSVPINNIELSSYNKKHGGGTMTQTNAILGRDEITKMITELGMNNKGDMWLPTIEITLKLNSDRSKDERLALKLVCENVLRLAAARAYVDIDRKTRKMRAAKITGRKIQNSTSKNLQGAGIKMHSRVKDINGYWIKASFSQILELFEVTEPEFKNIILALTTSKRNYAGINTNKEIILNAEQLKKVMEERIKQEVPLLEQMTLPPQSERPDFMEDRDDQIGVRQDTYLPTGTMKEDGQTKKGLVVEFRNVEAKNWINKGI
ncbi:hypothetical protein BGP78_01610 [Pseudoalteromonas sp. MSK9-3]|uniref:hypothetical protein n=1 Tax=Pseudoalteromonas sp. MSK9-3 TaxID=1897633 RepID=UPI000E6C5FE5|nr:hypothetical protein [Pseudoalteromonas sp. MSK9-3]RJE76970.1 hypothetical protein BGP78_01610 [Pseudoalteromonas sp. MSK9-3]